jgi:Methyltransferase domain
LVEIGVYHGVNTRMFREVADSSAIIYAVDPFFVGRVGISFNRIVARSNVAKCPRGTVQWIRDVSPTAISPAHIPPQVGFDFVFIDGDHSYEGVSLDWSTWTRRLGVRGVVALHDSRGGCGAGSEKFTTEVVLQDPAFEVVDAIDSLTVFCKIN